MAREIFRPNPIWLFIHLIIIILGLLLFYLYMIVYPIFTLPFPAWLLLFMFLPLVLSLISFQTTKLIVDGDTLRFVRGIFPRQEDAVSLLEVAKLSAKSGWGINYNTHTRIIHMIDKKGVLIFTIPGHLIGFHNIKDFRASVLAINPNIIID